MVDSAGSAVALALTLAAGYALWCGLLSVAEEAGVLSALARALKRPLGHLFSARETDDESLKHISANLAANALGLGNAATPEGIAAMRSLEKRSKGRVGDAMVMFLVINCSSVQLVPTTVIALRAAAGAASPADILLPTLFATAISTAVGVAAAKALAPLYK